MAISVTCSACDKSLKVKDELAGKKVKCPECEGVLSVPALKNGVASAASGAPRMSAGKKPSPQEEEEEASRAEDTADEKDPPRKSKKKKKKKSSIMPWLVGGGVAVVVVAAVLIILLSKGSDPEPFAKGPSPAPIAKEGDKEKAKEPGKGDPGLKVKSDPPPKGLVQGIRAAAHRPERLNELRQIALMFQQFVDERNGKKPASVQEFINYIQRDAPKIATALKEEYYILNLNVNMRSTEGVIAYESLIDAGGFQAARVGGSVSPVSREELEKLVMR